MDENFTPINPSPDKIPTTHPETDANFSFGQTASQPTTDDMPKTEAMNEQPVYGTPYQPTYQQQPSYTPPYNSQPYNAPPSGTPYPQQPIYQSAPIQGYSSQQPKKRKRNSSKIGKVVFVALICFSIIFASIAIGSIASGNNGNSANGNKTDSQNKGENNTNSVIAADPKVEDSPISYSKYSGSGAMTPEQIYQEVKDINVGIIVYAQSQKTGEGSGIVVGSDKNNKYTYILTAAHVIKGTNVSPQVQFNDGAEYDAIIVGVDEKTDVGVLRIEKTGFKAATFGNSDKLTVGQTIYAIGNPGGTEFFGSFTSGIISAIDRPVPTTNSSYDLPCIQHNAAINPGNSGGALVNEYGQVVGLNSSKISSTEYEGMGFAVPAETVLEVYKQIITNGYVTNRPMLGIVYFPVSSDYNYSTIAWQNNLPYGSVVISTINQASDIGNHGIKVGDIITAVNGEELETTDILLETIEKSDVGDKITLTICRLNNNGSINTTFDAEVKLVEDKGDNTVTQQQQESYSDPFSGYFEDFGY